MRPIRDRRGPTKARVGGTLARDDPSVGRPTTGASGPRRGPRHGLRRRRRALVVLPRARARRSTPPTRPATNLGIEAVAGEQGVRPAATPDPGSATRARRAGIRAARSRSAAARWRPPSAGAVVGRDAAAAASRRAPRSRATIERVDALQPQLRAIAVLAARPGPIARFDPGRGKRHVVEHRRGRARRSIAPLDELAPIAGPGQPPTDLGYRAGRTSRNRRAASRTTDGSSTRHAGAGVRRSRRRRRSAATAGPLRTAS